MDVQITFISLSIGAIFSTLIIYQLKFDNYSYLNISELFFNMNKPIIIIWCISIVLNILVLIVDSSYVSEQFYINNYDIYVHSRFNGLMLIVNGTSFLILLIYIYSLVNFIRKFHQKILKEKNIPFVLKQINNYENLVVTKNYFSELFKNNNTRNLDIAKENFSEETFLLCIFDEVNTTNTYIDKLNEVMDEVTDVSNVSNNDYFQKSITQLTKNKFTISNRKAIYLIKVNYELNKKNYEKALQIEKGIIQLTRNESISGVMELLIMYIEEDIHDVSHYYEEKIKNYITLYPEIPLLLISHYNKISSVEIKSGMFMFLDIEGNIKLRISEEISMVLWAHEINDNYNSSEELKKLIGKKLIMYNKRIKSRNNQYTSSIDKLEEPFNLKVEQLEKAQMLINDISDLRLENFFEEYKNEQNITDIFRSGRENFHEYLIKNDIDIQLLEVTDYDIESIVNNFVDDIHESMRMRFSLLQILNSKLEFAEIANIEKKQYRKLIQEFIKYTNPDIYFTQLSILEKLTSKVTKYDSDYMWDCMITGTSGLPLNIYYEKKTENWRLAYSFMELRRLARMLNSFDLNLDSPFDFDYEGQKIKKVNLFHFVNILKNNDLSAILGRDYTEIRTYFNSLEIDIFNNRLSMKTSTFDRQQKKMKIHNALSDFQEEINIIENYKSGNLGKLKELKIRNANTQKNLDFLIENKYEDLLKNFNLQSEN